MAIDVGTTTVAAYLCNLATMKVVDTASMMNPQCKYGEDVMSRITYSVMHEDGLERMSNDLTEGLNSLVRQACESTHPPKKKAKEGETSAVPPSYLCLKPEDLVDITIVGNTAMHHILLKLNPEHVGLAPFPPVVHRSLDIKARDLGIRINESAYICILPNEAGFVGADIENLINEAAILAARRSKKQIGQSELESSIERSRAWMSAVLKDPVWPTT